MAHGLLILMGLPVRAFEIMELQDRVKSSGSVPVFDGMGQN